MTRCGYLYRRRAQTRWSLRLCPRRMRALKGISFSFYFFQLLLVCFLTLKACCRMRRPFAIRCNPTVIPGPVLLSGSDQISIKRNWLYGLDSYQGGRVLRPFQFFVVKVFIII